MLRAILLLLLVQSSFSTFRRRARCSDESLLSNFQNSLNLKTITVITSNRSAPFISRIGNGVPFGLDYDLLNYIGYIYRVNFQFRYAAFQDFISIVQGDPSVISISSQTVTAERSKSVTFAQYFETGSGFIVRSSYSQTIDGLASLCGKTVAVQSTSIQAQDVQQQSQKCGTNPITIISVAAYSDLINLVVNGTAAVGVQDEALLITSARESGGQLKVVGTPYNVQPYGIVCNKASRGLCCSLVNAINYLIEEGVYGNLLERYSFSPKSNGVCPSRINLQGSVCRRSCVPRACKK